MHRNLHIIEINIDDLELGIGNVHLESQYQDIQRKTKQFRKTINSLSMYENALLMGDMNISDEDEVFFAIPDEWVDVWYYLDKPQDQKYSYDAKLNPYLKSDHQYRPDRIYTKSETFKPKMLKLIGKEIIDNIVPSDHFGLYCEIQR